MSIRTIIEINQDLLDRNSSMTIGDIIKRIEQKERELNLPSTQTKGCFVGSGITKLTSYHHSSDVEVRVNDHKAYKNREI